MRLLSLFQPLSDCISISVYFVQLIIILIVLVLVLVLIIILVFTAFNQFAFLRRLYIAWLETRETVEFVQRERVEVI